MDLISRDLKHIWHPCSQMKDYEDFLPLQITGANGPYLELADGTRIIDAISSWWCKSLGHGHPRLKAALARQMNSFEHVILANTTNRIIVELSEKLAGLTYSLDRVFYAGDGSTAVEIALKMSLQAQQLQGCRKRTKFIALENGYHGESTGALGLSHLGLYRDQYAALLPEAQFLKGLPYVSGQSDPVWHDCSEHWPSIEKQLNKSANTLAGIIIEPIVQGAGGMRIYSADFLKRIREWTRANGVYLIADEIMTGFGRTGKILACEHAGIEPDFLCLSKGLTAGWLPFSAVLTSTQIYSLFYDDYEKGKSFLHSNTYCGNALGAAVALEALKIYQEEKVFQKVEKNQKLLLRAMKETAKETECLTKIRGIGAVAAADLIIPEGLKDQRAGYLVFQEAVKLGALLRPLANTIYWFLPLNVESSVIRKLKEITVAAIKNTLTRI
jgi:adenosylmethionine-8-amino-7-oxononanoate aminotransferase